MGNNMGNIISEQFRDVEAYFYTLIESLIASFLSSFCKASMRSWSKNGGCGKGSPSQQHLNIVNGIPGDWDQRFNGEHLNTSNTVTPET